jgi:uncharacterized protein YjbI with pentapeptide repeats
MRKARYACAVLAAVTLVVGCGGNEREISNRFGDCTFRPKTVCTNQNLSAVAASNSDLNGANLSGANLTGADLRSVSLRGAKLVKTVLSSADLTGADLRNADLTGAVLIGTTLENADLTDTNQHDVTFCNTVMPDGSVTECEFLYGAHGAKPDRPPRILVARAQRPVKCIVDGIGDGIEVDYRTRNAQSVVFSVDDVRASDTNFARGIQRIPFTCDGHPHSVTVEAFGRATPPATRTFNVSVEEGAAQPLPR